MNFADAVQSIPEIAKCLRKGLQALGTNGRKIKVRATRDLAGSVDIDTCLKRIYPKLAETSGDNMMGVVLRKITSRLVDLESVEILDARGFVTRSAQFLVIVMVTFGSLPVYAANVKIPDTNLRAAIVEALGKRPRDSITTADMETLTELDLTNKGIRDLTGIQDASRLKGLKLTSNLIDDLTPISGLINLEVLQVGDNVISDLVPRLRI